MRPTLFAPVTAVVASLALAACLYSPDVADQPGEVTAPGDDKAATQVLPVMLACSPLFEQSRITADSVFIDGNILKAQLVHGGGCGTHKFTACFLSDPIEAWPNDETGGDVLVSQIGIQHETDDVCEALRVSDVQIDLGSLAALYRAEWGDAGHALTIDIGGGFDTITAELIIGEASDFEAGLREAAEGAVYVTEMDSSPAYVEAANIGTTNPTIRKIKTQFGVSSSHPVKAFSRTAALAWLAQRPAFSEDDDASDAAWMKLRTYIADTLGSSLRMYRIGPVAPSTDIDDSPDQHGHIYLFVGKDPADPAHLVGFYVRDLI
ncbi:MAG: hypothetical protein IPL79_10820 [Myxococcales bacterium]|nr:hypothetical protein [Myxococcales bacterium]